MVGNVQERVEGGEADVALHGKLHGTHSRVSGICFEFTGAGGGRLRRPATNASPNSLDNLLAIVEVLWKLRQQEISDLLQVRPVRVLRGQITGDGFLMVDLREDGDDGMAAMAARLACDKHRLYRLGMTIFERFQDK